jgi:rod shape-determining protein MreC
MAGRNIHSSNASVFSSFLIAAVILFLTPKSLTSKASLFFQNTFGPVLQIGRERRTDVARLEADSEDLVSHDKYARLWKSYNNLHAQLLSLHEDYERLANIRSGLPQLDKEALIMAQITGTGNNYSRELMINKGTRNFIYPGQFVLSEKKDAAIVGVISESFDSVARIRLITDTMQTLEVHIHRSGTSKNINAMMVGNGTDTCSISMVDRQQDIREGDTVFAAAVPGKLNIPLVVGEVTSVRPDDQHPLLWKITVRPAEDMSQLNNIAVIVADKKLLKEKD